MINALWLILIIPIVFVIGFIIAMIIMNPFKY